MIVSSERTQFTRRQGFTINLCVPLAFWSHRTEFFQRRPVPLALLTHSAAIRWGILGQGQRSFLFKDQGSDSSSGPQCPNEGGLPHGLQYKQLSSCFMGKLQAAQLQPGEGERRNLSLLSTPLGNPILPSHSSWILQSQAACWWE